MTTISLLTPPMDDSENLPEELQAGYFKLWQKLPPMTEYEQERVRTLSSLHFDEFYCENPHDMSYAIRCFFAKSRKYFEKYIGEMSELFRHHKYKTMERRVFYAMARLCHVIMLACDWTGALEIYQDTLKHDPYMFSKDPTLYYGLGLVYLHFKQWRPAIEAFTRGLYCHPTGSIALETKVRLAMCYMELEDYPRCLKLFYLALNDIEESRFMPKLIIKYNIALSHENHDELEVAETKYQKLLVDIEEHLNTHGKNLNFFQHDEMGRLTAACNRQLGWIEYRRTYKDEAQKAERLKKAQDLLTKANEGDSRDGQNYYYLGRVYGEQDMGVTGQVAHDLQAHESFVNYRHSIDKREQNGDTWCSIGALYQKQSQPMDALQAFICAIELNPKLSSAWTCLGELYEKNCQFQDALDCFKNAMKTEPVAPEPIKARVLFLEKELALPVPQKPPNHIILESFNMPIPSLKDAYDQPIPLELRNRQNAAYMERLVEYDNAWWDLWVDYRSLDIPPASEDVVWEVPAPRPMEDLEIQVMELLQANENSLVEAEREVLECLETSEVVFKGRLNEFIIPEAMREMPRVTEVMIQNLRDHGHLVENPRCYEFPFLPKCSYNDLPISFSLLSELYVSLDVTSEEIMEMLTKRATPNETFHPIFDEFAKLPEAPKEPEAEISEEDVKAALEKNERHPLMMRTSILTVDNRKEAQSLELQRNLDRSTIACIRGLTSCLRLDLSLFSTKAVMEIDGNQEIPVRTQYHLAPETNCDHAGQSTWECVNDLSYTTVANFAQYQSDSFKHTLKSEAEKIRKHGGGGRGPSPKRMKLHRRAPSPPKDLKSIKFGTKVDLSDDSKWGKQISELSKLPAFCRLIAGSNMLSHLGHQVIGMNTVQLSMHVPGARTTAHQESNNVASVNINIGPGDCEWFAVSYKYVGKLEKMCSDKGIDFFKGSFWPTLESLLEAGVPVHRFTQKAGDMVYVNGGSLHWMQSTGWCNTISWNVAPLNYHQLTISIHSYEYYKLRHHKSELPMQLLCWQLAKNVKFTNQMLYNTCKGVLIRSLAFLKIVSDYLTLCKKTVKPHTRTSGEQSHFCMTCECEVFSILFVKEIDNKFNVFCVYCTKSQGFDDFIVLQQFAIADLVKVYDNMKYIPTMNNNNKMSFTA